MPSAVYVPTHATTACGRNVEFGILQYGLWDLYDTGYLHLQEYCLADYWLRSYKNGGALPGAARFHDVFSGEEVYFLQMLDGVFEMYVAAINNERVNQSSSTTDTEPSTDSSVDLWAVRPSCIGRFGVSPQFRWVPPLNLDDSHHGSGYLTQPEH